MKITKSNKELLLLIKNDDRVAFYNLYQRYCKRIYGFVLRYIKLEAEAEEIVQEVFIKLWVNRNNIDVFYPFESYLFTITYNTTMSLLRKKMRERKYLEHLKSIQQYTDSPNITDEISYSELIAKVNSLLCKLSPRQKEIFMLSREKGLTHNEIAQSLNISVNTVKKHMTNTLTYLKSHITTNLLINVLFIDLFVL